MILAFNGRSGTPCCFVEHVVDMRVLCPQDVKKTGQEGLLEEMGSQGVRRLEGRSLVGANPCYAAKEDQRVVDR